MSAVVIDEGVVHYEYLGRGQPLIFIHGWLGSWRYWMSTMGDLSDAYRTYALDLWGFGDTDKAQPRYTLSEYVQLVLAFLDELGISRTPMIVGHSLGGLVALNMALMRPELADRLAFVSLPLDRQHINTKSLVNGKGVPTGGLFKKTKEYEPVIKEIEKTDKLAIESSVSSLNGIDIRDKLALLQVPTLLVYGAKDSIITSSPGDDLSALKPEGSETLSVRTMLMSQCRHFPMLEEPNTFNRLLRDFLLMDVSEPEVIHSLEFKEEWRRRMR